MESKKRFVTVAGAAILVLSSFTAYAGENQALTAAAKATLDVTIDPVDAAAIQEFSVVSIKSAPDFLNHEGDIPPSFVVTPGSLAGVNSVPNFSGAFSRLGTTFPFTMMGTDPALGHKIDIPTPIVAVSLQLQNADLTTFTTVSVEPFVNSVLASPNFQKFKYEHSGEGTQFADAVQRAEFASVMKENWHTNLAPKVVDHVSIQIPRFINARINGKVTPVRTFFTGTAADGSTFVLLLSNVFNQDFFNVAVNAINANQFTTGGMNILLFPNTFLFSLSRTGGIGNCCTLGFHTLFTDDSVTPLPAWVTAYASWISPGLFNGLEDITGMSHEISESFNDPFLNNATPSWQFPGEPGVCQGNLETGDPVEVLANPSFPVTFKADDDDKAPSITFHPQTEALLQWFNGAIPSDALHGAYSYPDTTALTAPSIVCK